MVSVRSGHGSRIREGAGVARRRRRRAPRVGAGRVRLVVDDPQELSRGGPHDLKPCRPPWVPPGRVALQVPPCGRAVLAKRVTHCHQSRSGSWSASSSADLRALRAAWPSAHSSSSKVPSTTLQWTAGCDASVARRLSKQEQRPFQLLADCNADAVSNADTRDGPRSLSSSITRCCADPPTARTAPQPAPSASREVMPFQSFTLPSPGKSLIRSDVELLRSRSSRPSWPVLRAHRPGHATKASDSPRQRLPATSTAPGR
jgi:hypothetical protein